MSTVNHNAPDDPSWYRLDENTHALILRVIQERALEVTRAAIQPVAIILGGQPGAGKAALASEALDDLGGNAVKVDADETRKFHPDYVALMNEDDRSAADRTHADAGPWAAKLTSAAIAGRRHLVIDGTMRDPVGLSKLCQKLRNAGYRIEARVMAVNALVSRMSIHERYERQLEVNGYGRWTNRDKHDAAFNGVPLTVESLEADCLVDRITVVARNGDAPLYDNRLVDGAWEHPPTARTSIEAERSRDWTEAERTRFSEKLDRVTNILEQRGASALDLAGVAELRADFEATRPALTPTTPTQKIRLQTKG
ncbi:UDP-N-acetylglucosamine kinase (modular protein) [Burkholderia diffusa]|uniref:zeta toxin family protein n=1 Tax=Burkholderia diffusa TaxID=488732 RepID=UPI001CB2E4CF|nr:zeta toxin family protein [Burkholderia diffusa]CAG9260924.1 UDP-N-acetylglucosamine kinase (modular protein) [Burkholderia diffusa]